MPAIVLESTPDSEYDDGPTSLEFPERYRDVFAPLDDGAPIFAVIYEPRGDGAGRMAYVGLATITRPPVSTGGRSRNGQRLWRVEYDAPARPFDQPVPREVFGEPLERWLGERERGRSRNVATLGLAVRPLADADFQRILELGNAAIIETVYPERDEHQSTDMLVAERIRRLVEAFERQGLFRDHVLSAYEHRCAVSGLGPGTTPRSRSLGLIDAAHIRPVSKHGSDAVSNGLPLTPTLHRLFDAGLFTVAYDADRPRVRVSPHLTSSMLEMPDRGFVLNLHDGLQLLLPARRDLWPHPEQLRFHEREVFRSA